MRNRYIVCALQSAVMLFLLAGPLAGCSGLSAPISGPKRSVPVHLRVSLPQAPSEPAFGLQGSAPKRMSPVALLLRLKSEDGRVQEKSLSLPEQDEATFDVPLGKVEIEARYVVGHLMDSPDGLPTSSAANSNEVAATLIANRACVAPNEVGYWVASSSTSQFVSENTTQIDVTVGALSALPLVPAGAFVQTRVQAGFRAAAKVRLVPLDPSWNSSLPSACAGRSIGEASTNTSGVASLRLPLFPGQKDSLKVRYETSQGSGLASLPIPSPSNFKKNLHKVTFDSESFGLAQVEPSSDPVRDFGPGFFAEIAGPVDATRICRGTTLLGVAGTAICDAPPAPRACSTDGETGCLSSATFPAANTTDLASKVLTGQSVAGVAGNVTLPPAAAVRTGNAFGVSNAISGALADCALDGATGCVATVGFPAANLTSLSPGNIRKAATIGGVTGDYPSSTYPLPGASGTDLPSLSSSVAAGSYQFWQQDGTRVAGSISDAGTITVGTSIQTFNTSLYRQFMVPGDADLVAANIASGVNILGVAGSAPARPADCASDGDTDCVVPSSGTIKAADTANFNGWDIRKKRSQTTGAVLTFAGIPSQGKSHCRNRVNTALFDNTTSPAAVGLDIVDTIDDHNNNLTGLPGEIPTWTVINSTSYGADYACGGIYATGDTATGNTGADASLAHDPDGNWQDLTPGIVPGGANSTNTANGCNAADKHCVFRELISGLMVTEVSAATYVWANAISYCHNLGEAGGAVTTPIPVIGGATYSDWRLPTQKELMQLYNAGIRGLNQTSNLTAVFGDVDPVFWSSSSVSGNASSARSVHLSGGESDFATKSLVNRVICVR
jgi:hypothetical protein